MATDKTVMDPQVLEAAFALFSQASAELTDSWQQLQDQVAQLTGELAVANGALRRQFEEKQALSRRLALLLEALPGGVVVLDANDVVCEANPAALQLLDDALIGRPWPETAARLLAPTGLDGEWATAAGARLAMSVRALEDGAGSILLLQDVSRLHAMQVELERHRRLSAMGEMAAGLAHQLRTPLATALLYTSHLGRPGLAEADRQRFAERALARLRHLESLIQDMLRFVRGETAAAAAEIDLAALVAEIAQVMEPQMQARGLRFTAAAAPARLRGDREALAGALMNLLENAMLADAGSITLALEVRNGYAELAVRDDGRGIAASDQARLFEPFFTTRSDGTGLGLAIVRQVVEAHGGVITVQSAPGAGATFILRLPLPAAAGEAG